MKNKKISGVLIYLFCFALVLLLYMNFTFTPLNSKIAELDTKHAADTAQIQIYEQQTAKMGDLKDKIAKLQSQVEQADTNTAITANNEAEDIEAACKAAGIVPESVNMGDETADKSKTSSDGKSLCSVPIDLKAKCNGNQLQTLLAYFEKKSKGAYYVNKVSYTQGQDKPEVTLSLTLYYFSLQGTKG
jgi:hypothetical protein